MKTYIRLRQNCEYNLYILLKLKFRKYPAIRVVTMHRCIAILGPTIRVLYRDLCIAIRIAIHIT